MSEDEQQRDEQLDADASDPETSAPADELEGKTAEELYQLASELAVKGRSKMARDELLEAVRAARDKLRESGGEAPPTLRPGPPVEPERDAFGDPLEKPQPRKALSVEEMRKIRGAPSSGLEELLEAADRGEARVEPHLLLAVRAELDRRAQAEREAAAMRARTTPMDRYVVTVGGRFVTSEGYVTTLRPEQTITPSTHDFRALRAQGIRFERVARIEVRETQAGDRQVVPVPVASEKANEP